MMDNVEASEAQTPPSLHSESSAVEQTTSSAPPRTSSLWTASNTPVWQPRHHADRQPTDLSINIEKYLKHGDSIFESHVVFLIVTKTTRPEFGGEEFEVHRRYSDFVWLQDRLQALYPTTIVPPLPPKHVGKMNKFDPTFLEPRKLTLERFLRLIARHPQMCKAVPFIQFVTAKAHEFTSIRKSSDRSGAEKLADSMTNFAAKVMNKADAPRYEIMKETQSTIAKHLKTLSGVTSNLAAAQAAMEQNYMDMSVECGAMVESDTDAKALLRIMQEALKGSGEPARVCRKKLETETNQVLRDLLLTNDPVKRVLLERDFVQANNDMIQETLMARREEKKTKTDGDFSKSVDVMMGRKDADTVKREKLEALDGKIAQLEHESAESAKRLKEVNDEVDREWHDYEGTLHEDVLAAIGAMALAHVQRYSEAHKAWDTAEQKLQEWLAADA